MSPQQLKQLKWLYVNAKKGYSTRNGMDYLLNHTSNISEVEVWRFVDGRHFNSELLQEIQTWS